MTVLLLKHFVVESIIQQPYSRRYKEHSVNAMLQHGLMHGVGTATVLCACLYGAVATAWPIIVAAAIADAAIHALIDSASLRSLNSSISAATQCAVVSDNICPHMNRKFWIVHGLDQLLHSCTYIAVAAAVSRWV